jgi:tetratricopeptide (TPR) repeat protein
VYANFAGNLRDILRAGKAAGVPVVLSTVAVNLKDCPPFASMGDARLSDADRAKVEQLLKSTTTNRESADLAAATTALRQAVQLDTQSAEAQYRLGTCLLAQTNLAGARIAFERACDLDALSFRADGRINGAIRDAGRATGVTLVDAAAALTTNSPGGICGDELLYEHVHLNFDGNYLLARAWAEVIAPLLPPGAGQRTGPWASQEACERRLGLTDWNRSLVWKSVERRFTSPPLSGQANNAARLAALQRRIAELTGRMTPAASNQARADFQEMLQRFPEDHYLRENYAVFLQATGDPQAAVDQWRQVQTALPQDFVTQFQLGRLLGQMGHSDEARETIQRALALHPDLTEGWVELGKVYFNEGKFEEALAACDRALTQLPGDPVLLYSRGKTLTKLGRRADAIESYRRAVQLRPGYWEAHFELAGELSFDEKVAEAEHEFGEVVRLNPGFARAHFNLGVMLAKQRRWDEAEREFQETTRLEPDYQPAHQYLSQVRSLKARGP